MFTRFDNTMLLISNKAIQLLTSARPRSWSMKAKSFDAVKFMRERRDELSRKYSKNPEMQKEELFRIKRKYSAFKHIAAKASIKDIRPFAR